MEPNELPDSLARIRRLNTYKVPPHYFDTLADDILSKVHIPVASVLPLSAPPAGYFDGLADNILQKIKTTQKSEPQQELEEVDLFLAGVPKINPYTVPQGYFDAFKVPMQSAIAAPVLKMSRRSPARWITYAAAAVITGVVATGAILFVGQNDSNPPSEKYKAALSKVSDSNLADYLNSSLPDADIVPASSTRELNSNGLYHQLLNNVSDNDIQQYLNENDDSNEKTTTGI